MKTILVVIAALIAQVPAREEANQSDPFADDPVDKQDHWPATISPSKEELKVLGEPDLSKEDTKQSLSVRFIWVPTFDHPISIRAFRENDKAKIKVVQMAGKGGYEWGKVEFEKTIPIDEKQWSKLVELYSVDGARKPSHKLKEDMRAHFVEMMSGFDGSEWFLEVRDMKRYTVEGVPNPLNGIELPEKSLNGAVKIDFKEFLAVCYYLFDLSGLKDRPKY